MRSRALVIGEIALGDGCLTAQVIPNVYSLTKRCYFLGAYILLCLEGAHLLQSTSIIRSTKGCRVISRQQVILKRYKNY
jgi:hypothetical protein